MDRYDKLDLDLECDGGGVAQKAALFSGMFKKSSKSAEPFIQAQDSLSASGELSKSSDSLTDNTKDKGGVFKGMFKKTTKSAKEGQPQATLSLQNPEFSASSDSLTDNKPSKDKSGVLGGIMKRSPKPGHVRRPSQDLLDNELSGSNDNLSENTNTKESGGLFSGMFKKSPKPIAASTQSQDDLSAATELSGSSDNLSANGNTKESGGMFSGIFKKTPKPFGARTQSQEDLSAPSEISGSSDNLSENNMKEKGLLSGVFRKKGAKSQSQDDLSMDGELSASSDSLIEKSSKGGVAAKILKNPFTSSSQEKEKTEHSGDSNENTSATEKPKVKQNGLSAMMKSTFYSDKQEKNLDTDGEEPLDNGEGQPSHKQNKLAGAMTKLNPFRSANKNEKQTGSDDEDPPASSDKPSGNRQKDTEDTETLKENEKQEEENPKPVKSNMIQRERKERTETPLVPPRPTEEEMKRTSAYDKVKPRGTEDNQDKKDALSRQKKEKPAETPVVPARPSEEEMNKAVRSGLQKQKSSYQSQSDDEGLKQDESAEAKDGDEVNPPESKTAKEKKHKHHNPFMPRVAAKASSDDEELKEKDESLSKEEKKEDEGKDKREETKVKKPKRHNPFMPRVKAKVIQRHEQDEAAGSTAENEGGKRSLFDQLEDFRTDPARPEDEQDVEDLMEWWNTVEPWEDRPANEDMTEKEEAKEFAVTAEKVQKGIRVFNKLFSERAESLWQHVIDLNGIADGLDKFNKNTKIAQITGGSTSAIGGVATIAGLALAPVTMGTSLIVTAVGLGVATAGGLTSAGAGISNQVNNSMDRKKVEKIVEDYQEKILDLNKCLKFIKQGIENLRRFDLIKMKKHAYNQDFPVLSSSFYEDGAMAGKAILINANEIMRVVQIANVAGSTAARAVQIASMATGVLTGLFVGMDIYFVAKDSKELKKGAKSEFAAKIREVATQLHDGLVELNGIREELQSTTQDSNTGKDTAALDNDKKAKDDKYDSSDEDEIDRIKKAIKKDIENREYV
ncbi:histone-lysine N-methyltransferase, H3 lysine-79 specific-like isoform X2 [Toxotes jaculatrix]|uniref:histone-lysine N-methyltransferase, H3 lysine-79 specific-like isoform X2 n=1 Tax=Toxotes jaculatrix TaxID=941984 RepID=UPI001B3B086C|nr:histone-lysine N-methyltransferase, H3 lysine-79 specific-like isoform X2 [Toxotes jaculatrix]